MGPSLGAHLWNRDAASLRQRAADLEALGFSSLTVGDHLGYLAPLAACAIIAEATTHVRLGPLVLNNDFRHPVVLAQEAAALADLSGGRFELGLGAGYARREYEASGIAFSSRRIRVARLAESARILRALFAGERVSCTGAHYELRGASLPPPIHPIPILVGGNSPEVQAAAAAHADVLGLAGSANSRFEGSDYASAAVERQVGLFRELAGERSARIELQILVQWHEVTDDRLSAAKRAAPALEVPVDVVLDSPYVLLGTAAEIAKQIREHHARFGLTRWTVFADRPDLQRAEELVPVLELLGSPMHGR
jgi:probable F420-dependent oxidoreductase